MTNAEAEDYLATLKRHFMPRLTEWEYSFVQNLSDQVQRTGAASLSMKQRNKLDEIMTRCAKQYSKGDGPFIAREEDDE